MSRSAYKQYFPLRAFVAYILLTMALAFWGPVEYVGLDRGLITVYMAAFLGIFSIGYILGLRRKTTTLLRDQASVDRSALRFVKAAIVITVAYKAQKLLEAILAGKLTLSLAAIGRSYLDLYAGYVRGQTPHDLGYVLGLAFYLPLLVSLTLGFHYFKQLSVPYRLALVAIIGLVLIVDTLGQGKQKQFGDIVISCLSVFAIRIGIRANRTKGRKSKSQWRVYAAAAVLLCVSLVGFVNVLASRYQALGIGARNILSTAHPLQKYQLDNPLVAPLGDDMGFAAAAFSTYLSQGYLGLSLSMKEPFIWTKGVGNSYAMTMLFGKLLDLPVSVEDSYPVRVGVSTGWGLSKWHTVFAWLASDLTFPGVLLFFFFVALLYAQCWREATVFGNPISVLLFCLLSLGLVFVPANNQLLQPPEGVIAVFAIVVIWLRYHRYLNSAPIPSSPVAAALVPPRDAERLSASTSRDTG